MTAGEHLDADGYTFLKNVYDAAAVRAILAGWQDVSAEHRSDPAMLAGENGPAYGARELLRMWPRVVELARAPGLLAVLGEILGRDGGVVRGLFFDKPPGHSWALPWHRDYTVAVRAHGRIGLFKKPTTKAGVPHLEAPTDLLAGMVTVRIHLDDMTDENGSLRVIPGSHRLDDAVPKPPVTLECRAGDVLLMRPLLSHSSGHSRPGNESHRRIVHLECAPTPHLPDGYEWHDFVRLASD